MSIDNLKIPEDKKRYINERLNPLLTELVTDCLKKCPQEPALFMLEWLKKKQAGNAGAGASGNAGAGGGERDDESLRAENARLKADIEALTSTLKETGALLGALNQPEKSDDEEDDDEDCPDELPAHLTKNTKGPRQSVSAEAYGAWNKKKDFVPRVISKTEEQKQRLKSVLGKSFLFSEGLDEKDFLVIIDAMDEKTFNAGDVIINQGDDGDYLFVVESGNLECYKDINGVSTVVKTCTTGDIFGELALLYNTTRAANVRSTTDACVLWQLDRETFNSIVKDAAAQKRSRYESFLKSVNLLKQMTPYELSQIADALKIETYQDGEDIVREGEPGDKFYIVESGNPVALKGGQVVMEYKQADYFGELALLMEQPRLATVRAGGVTKVLCLDRKSFNRLLGNLDTIMRRAVSDRYS